MRRRLRCSGVVGEERGSISVLLAAAMVAIFGFGALSVDVGRAFVTRQRLQDVADAAALAGASHLPDAGAAEDAARSVAAANGIPDERVEVAFPGDAIRVSVSADVHYLFAPVLGFMADALSASATARAGGVVALSGGRWDRRADDYPGGGGDRGCDESSGERSEDRGEDGSGDAVHQDGEDSSGDHEADAGDGEDGTGEDHGSHHEKKSKKSEESDGQSSESDGEDPESGHDGEDEDVDSGHGDENGEADQGSEDPGGCRDGSGDAEGDDGTGDAEGDGQDARGGRDGEAEEGRVNGGAVPLAVEKADFVVGQLVTLKLGAGQANSGNFHALALGGTGAANYLRNLKYGFPGTVRVGHTLRTEPGNMVGPTEEGIRWRIEQDPAATADTVAAGSPRVMYVVVVDSFDGVHGRGEVSVAGFAAFFIEEYAGNGEVRGRFLRWVTTGEGGGPAAYGLQQVTLLQ